MTYQIVKILIVLKYIAHILAICCLIFSYEIFNLNVLMYIDLLLFHLFHTVFTIKYCILKCYRTYKIINVKWNWKINSFCALHRFLTERIFHRFFEGCICAWASKYFMHHGQIIFLNYLFIWEMENNQWKQSFYALVQFPDVSHSWDCGRAKAKSQKCNPGLQCEWQKLN